MARKGTRVKTGGRLAPPERPPGEPGTRWTILAIERRKQAPGRAPGHAGEPPPPRLPRDAETTEAKGLAAALWTTVTANAANACDAPATVTAGNVGSAPILFPFV